MSNAKRIAAPTHNRDCRPFGIRVQVTNETDQCLNVERVAAAVQAALEGSAYDRGSVSVAVVGDAVIHGINREFLSHDYPTDVISFSFDDNPPVLEGEIVVSVETAERVAQEVGWSTEAEILLYVVHGALHLIGHDDHDPADLRAMKRREVTVLHGLGVSLAANDERWGGMSRLSSDEEGSTQ